MKLFLKIIFALIVLAFVMIAGLGMYKFNYLAGKEGYDVDGNPLSNSDNRLPD